MIIGKKNMIWAYDSRSYKIVLLWEKCWKMQPNNRQRFSWSTWNYASNLCLKAGKLTKKITCCFLKVLNRNSSINLSGLEGLNVSWINCSNLLFLLDSFTEFFVISLNDFWKTYLKRLSFLLWYCFWMKDLKWIEIYSSNSRWIE